MARRKRRFSLIRFISRVSKFIRHNRITSEKAELYLYRLVIFIIIFIHLVKFLWYTVSH